MLSNILKGSWKLYTWISTAVAFLVLAATIAAVISYESVSSPTRASGSSPTPASGSSTATAPTLPQLTLLPAPTTRAPLDAGAFAPRSSPPAALEFFEPNNLRQISTEPSYSPTYASPTTNPTPAPSGGEQCKDIQGWYDSNGPVYDCQWYEEYDACEYAAGYENDGYTAKEACCVCGSSGNN